MLSDTLAKGLAEYRIGPKIRECRARKLLALADLAAHTGLSPALLSKIERGHIFPTLPTLLRIALVFGVGLEHFFLDGDEPAQGVTRARERVKLPNRPGSAAPTYLFESLNYPFNDRPFEAYAAEFPPGRPATEPHRHDGTEFIQVHDGSLVVTIGEREHRLGAGDTLCFDASASHGYRCEGRRTARVTVVTAP